MEIFSAKRPMKMQKTIFFLCFCAISLLLTHNEAFAQTESSTSAMAGINATPKDGLEFGIHGGHMFSAGDLDIEPGFGTGLHFRKALDYIFSLRFEGLYAIANGSSEESGQEISFPDIGNSTYDFKHTTIGGTAEAIFTLNNLRWNNRRRKANIYVGVGAGAFRVKTEATSNSNPSRNVDILSDLNWAPAATGAVGVSFRLSPSFNLGIEHKIIAYFGRWSDNIDGFGTTTTTTGDILNYTNIRLNFNLTKGKKLSEPLYWVNPMEVIIDDLAEVKERPVVNIDDTDGDGVIDLLDQDNNTPPGVTVDTKGIAMDTDKDGVADYMDKEPLSPPDVAVDGEGVADYAGDYVTRNELNQAINNLDLSGSGAVSGGSVDGWYLPMINFASDSYKVRTDDYAKLYNIATVMQENPGLKVLVIGYTDQTAGDTYNNSLSYKRAEAAIKHMSEKYNIDEDRFIIQYGGKNSPLVPTSSSSLMNRRVEFKIAKPGDESMPAPGSGMDFEGSKGQGY